MSSKAGGPKHLTIQPLDRVAKLATDIEASVGLALQTLFETPPMPRDRSLEQTCSVRGDVNGIMPMIQDGAEGSFILSFPKKTIFGLLAKTFGKAYDEVDSFVESAVGELTNVVYGLVKSKLNEQGFDFKMAVPTVLSGDGLKVVSSAEGATLIIPFETEAGPFVALITRKPRAAAVKAA